MADIFGGSSTDKRHLTRQNWQYWGKRGPSTMHAGSQRRMGGLMIGGTLRLACTRDA